MSEKRRKEGSTLDDSADEFAVALRRLMECGAGRNDVPPRPWTTIDLAYALDPRKIPDRKVRFWRSGKHRPQREDFYSLIEIFFPQKEANEHEIAKFEAAWRGDQRGSDIIQLRSFLERIAECAQTCESESQSALATDLAQSVLFFLDFFDDEHNDTLQQKIEARIFLLRLESDAEAHLFLRHFTASPLKKIIEVLTDISSRQLESEISVSNTRDHQERYEKVVVPLLKAIEEALFWLDNDNHVLNSNENNFVRVNLKRLRFLVKSLSFNPKELDVIRGQIEKFKVSLIQRTVILTEILIGYDAHLLPRGIVFRDHENGPELVVVEGGTFFMGSDGAESMGSANERPKHLVEIGFKFALGRYPVTLEEFDKFCKSNDEPCPEDEGWGTGRRPVINVSWDQAKSYCTWLNTITEQQYDLPSEAVWEFSCRAGTSTAYWWGDQVEDENLNYNNIFNKTTEVGRFRPNPWGFFDMLGNVREWVNDYWHENYDAAPDDGSAWFSGNTSSRRVLRGGSWDNSASLVRSASRFRLFADGRNFNIGIRVFREIRKK